MKATVALWLFASFLLWAETTRSYEANWTNTWYGSDGYLTGVPTLKQFWVPMTQREALFFYTPYELCQIAGARPGCQPATHVGDLGVCNTGYQAVIHQDKICSQNSGFLMRFHTTHPWPKSANLVDLVKNMNARGSNTVILVGDSVQGQMLGDARCALTRLGLPPAQTFGPKHIPPGFKDGFSVPHNVPGKAPFFQMLLMDFAPSGWSESQVALQSLNATLWPDASSSNNGGSSSGGGGGESGAPLSATVRGDVVYVMNYGLHFGTNDPNDNADRHYEKICTALFQLVMQRARPNDTIIFRETSAQHFQTDTGMFTFAHLDRYLMPYSPVPQGKTRVAFVSQAARRAGLHAALAGAPLPPTNTTSNITSTTTSTGSTITTTITTTTTTTAAASSSVEDVLHPDNVPASFGFMCQPIANETMLHQQNWRNVVVKKVVQLLDPAKRRVHIAPFYKATASRHDLHPFEVSDCTHFCSSPMLWAPLWEAITHLYHHHYRVVAASGR